MISKELVKYKVSIDGNVFLAKERTPIQVSVTLPRIFNLYGLTPGTEQYFYAGKLMRFKDSYSYLPYPSVLLSYPLWNIQLQDIEPKEINKEITI